MQQPATIRELPDEWVKLNLGCNQNVIRGWINVDVHEFDGVDVVANLEERWPWDDNSVHYVRAYDIFEHLHNPVHSMNEAWRVLAHGGILEVLVPSTDGRGAFQDPTHVSFWNQNSFLYYSKKNHGSYYLHLVLCDFDCRVMNTQANQIGVIWTLAICRAIKGTGQSPVIDDNWYDALTNSDPEKRVIPGFQGSTLGTNVATEQ